MSEERPSISPGETEVLKAVWRIDKGSIGEIFSEIESELEMDYSTVQTYVRRLEAKGYIESKRHGRNKTYRATIDQSEVLESAVDDFVQLHFDGQLLPMIKHLVDTRDVSDDELKDLMKIVRQLKKDKGGRDAR